MLERALVVWVYGTSGSGNQCVKIAATRVGLGLSNLCGRVPADLNWPDKFFPYSCLCLRALNCIFSRAFVIIVPRVDPAASACVALVRLPNIEVLGEAANFA